MSRKIINQYFDTRRKAEGKVLSPRASFTQALLDWLPNQEFDYEIIDQSRSALRCRVRKGGSAKSLVIIKRIKDGPLKRIKICSVGELPLTANKDVISVETEYQRIMGELLKGESGRHQRAVTDTFANVLSRYIADTDLAKGSITNYEIVRDVYLAEWRDRPLRSITPELCKKKFREITNREVINKEGQQRGGPSAANTSMKVVRALFNFMAEESEEKGLPPFPASPTRTLNSNKGGRKKKSVWNVEKERDGRINQDQLKAWWGATERLPEEYNGHGELARDYLQFVLLTGMRRREVTGLEWSDITMNTVTARNTKNGVDHTLPITPPMKAILERRKEYDKPFSVNEVRRFTSWVTKHSNVEFTIHDLRRTFAGYAEHGCEMPLSVVSVLLNHKGEDSITKRYSGQMGIHRKGEKLQAVQDYILKVATNDAEPTELGVAL